MRSKSIAYRSVLVSAADLALQPTVDDQPNEIGEMNHVDQTAMNDIDNREELYHAQ